MSAAAAGKGERLIGFVRRFEKRRVVVLGDLVVDEFVYGDITRISREAPVLILEHDRTELVPGGGGNSVANIRALGAIPVPVGVVGADAAGKRLMSELKRRRIPLTGLLVDRAYSTPSKSRILAGGVHTRRQQIVRLDSGTGPGELPVRARNVLRRSMRQALRTADGLLLADYGYGAATPETLESVAPALKRSGIPVTVDSRSRVAEFKGVTACTPNQEELEQALGLEPLGDNAVAGAGRKLLRKTGDSAVLVTRGAKGMILFERGRRPTLIPAFGSGEVADVTGAGDTVITVFTLALIAGAGFADAAMLANYAAGLVVAKAGTATVSGQELIEAVEKDLGR
jgi:rfaE bifunctional protein kinase chain/domain